jgi:transposase
MQRKSKWSPGPGVKILDVALAVDDSWVVSAAGPTIGICPDCGRRSRSRHGWSNRSLQDLPAQGKPRDGEAPAEPLAMLISQM